MTETKKLICSNCGKQFPIILLNSEFFYQKFKKVGTFVYRFMNLQENPNTIYFCGTVCRNNYIKNRYKKKKF